jgi:hypothetical protein
MAAFELLAVSDYVAAHKTPILSLAAAEDMSQRKLNPYLVRASATSAQSVHPLADHAAKELKYKSVTTISEDVAFGNEQMGGFQRVFEDAGGPRRYALSRQRSPRPMLRFACKRAAEDNPPRSPRSACSVSVLRQADKRGVGGIARPAPFRECRRPREQ